MVWDARWLLLFLIPEVSGITLRLGLEPGAGEDLAAALNFATVVQVEVDAGGLGRDAGSGLFLNQEWVLTAGHVVEAAGAGRVSIMDRGVRRRVSQVVSHPGWSRDSATGLGQGNDLTLLRLAVPVPGVPVVPLWQGSGPGPLIGLMAGYGRGGNGLLGGYLPGGTLQAAFNVVDRIVSAGEGAFWVTDFDSGQVKHNSLNYDTVDLRYFDRPGDDPLLSEVVFGDSPNASRVGFDGLPGARDFFPGLGEDFPEGTTARGDSGGPLFLFSSERARWELAGVTSFGVNPLHPGGFERSDSRYGDLSFFADVSGETDWLAEAMIPEPSTVGLLAGGLILLLARRKSRPVSLRSAPR